MPPNMVCIGKDVFQWILGTSLVAIIVGMQIGVVVGMWILRRAGWDLRGAPEDPKDTPEEASGGPGRAARQGAGTDIATPKDG